MIHPYSELTFFEVWGQFISRFFQALGGNISLQDLAPDEIQALVLIFVSFSCSLIGSFLVLRRETMLANSLSHTILIGIIGVYLWTNVSFSFLPIPSLLIASLLTGLVTTFLTNFCHRVFRLQEDASIGLVFTSLFSIGIILVTLFTKSAHIGIEAVMGNVDALHTHDIHLVFFIALVNIFIFILFFKEFALTTFDRDLAHALGFSTLFFDYLLMIQVSATTIGAFRAVGVLMVLALIVVPPLIARLFTHSLKRFVILSVGVGILASLTGIALSRHLFTVFSLTLSTGGLIVSVLFILYLSSLLLRKLAT